MEKRSFLIDDGMMSIHYDSLNPTEVRALIDRMEANLVFLMSQVSDPIEVMSRTLRRNRLTNEITFQLGWGLEPLRILLNDQINQIKFPEPNRELNTEQLAVYYQLLAQVAY